MPTILLTACEYNDALVGAALAAHRATAARNGNPGKGPSREGAGRGIAGRENPPSGTRFETGFRYSGTGSGSARRPSPALRHRG
jgi:hypothetical protein